MSQKCGFVAVIGPPNAGKSTLSNALVGQKVAIVTQKAQTYAHAVARCCHARRSADYSRSIRRAFLQPSNVSTAQW
jgi:GTPase Era involved in 16S rRNA processing